MHFVSTARTLAACGVAALWLLLPAESLASPVVPPVPIFACSAGLVSSMLGQTCAIGDMTFQFSATFAFQSTAADGTRTSLPFNNVMFTPDDSNPVKPGFVLSQPSGFSFTTSGLNPLIVANTPFVEATWNYQATIRDASSGAHIVGTTVQVGGAVVTPNGPNSLFVGARNTIRDSSNRICGDAAAMLQFEEDQVLFSNLPSVSDDSTHGCGNTLKGVSGFAGFALEALNGTASIDSAGFYIDQAGGSPATPAPEPSSLGLLLSAMIGMGVLKKAAAA